MTLELRQLEHFVTVAEEQSFTRAADRLHISQSPLSASVRRLEARLGVRLLERTTRRVELTPAGTALLIDARRLLDDARASAARVRQVADGATRAVTIAHTATVGYELVPALSDLVRQTDPDLVLCARELACREAIRRVRAGTADLALCCAPQDAAGLRRVPIAREPMVVLLPADHPLADRRVIALPELRGSRFQLFPREDAPMFFDALTGLLEAGGAAPQIVIDTIGDRRRAGIAKHGLLALAPRALSHVRVEGVTAVPVADPTCSVLVEAVLPPTDISAATEHVLQRCSELRTAVDNTAANGRRPAAHAVGA